MFGFLLGHCPLRLWTWTLFLLCLVACEAPKETCPGERGDDGLCHVCEEFEVFRARPIDILFVVGNSVSMCEEQAILLENFQYFAELLVTGDVIDFLYKEGVTPLPALEDMYSAQHRAAIFVADGDVYQAPLGPKLVERYVLSLIYYYFDGPEWKNNYKFLSGRDHCEWFTTETRPLGTILKGVNCNDDGYVTGLDLCKLPNYC